MSARRLRFWPPACCCRPRPRASQAPTWQPLFNGKDLDRLDAEDPRLPAGRELRQHVPGRGWAAEGGLRSLRPLRPALRPPGLEAAAVALPAAHRIPLRRPAGAGRPGLGPAQQRGDAARAAARDHGPGPELPGVAGGAVPGWTGQGPAPHRQRLHARNPRGHGRAADHQALHELALTHPRRRRLGHGRGRGGRRASPSSTWSTGRWCWSTASRSWTTRTPTPGRCCRSAATSSCDEGYIYLQAESHPVEFRRVEMMPLDPSS